MRVNIIGSGKVGQTLARLFVLYQQAEIVGIYNRTKEHGLAAQRFIGQGQYYSQVTDLPFADISLIATNDDSVASISNLYSKSSNIQPGNIVFHCSGVLTSDCLSSLRDKGCFVASIHPMHSFIDPVISIEKYAGTYCALEGDMPAVVVLKNLFTSIGSVVFSINKQKKVLYHAAGVFASNYLLTLAQQSLDCLYESEIDDVISLTLVINLMQSTLNNLLHKKSPRAALTGPIRRGDRDTLQKHIDAFVTQSQREFYEFMLNKTEELLIT